jgi:hypothetical protein
MNISKAFITVPDGSIPLKEFLAAPTAKEFIKIVRADARTTGRKLRVFLAFYQTLDMLGQLQQRGIDTSAVDIKEIAAAADMLIDSYFDMIINSFKKKDRALLNALFNEPAYAH